MPLHKITSTEVYVLLFEVKSQKELVLAPSAGLTWVVQAQYVTFSLFTFGQIIFILLKVCFKRWRAGEGTNPQQAPEPKSGLGLPTEPPRHPLNSFIKPVPKEGDVWIK